MPKYAAQSVRLVRQKDPTGCGIACIAMLSGTRYKDVRSRFKEIGPRLTDGKRFYTNAKEVCRLGALFGVEFERTRLTPIYNLENLPDLAILRVSNLCGDTRNWHWVVFQRGDGKREVFDPQKKRLQKIRKLYVTSYLRVVGTPSH